MIIQKLSEDGNKRQPITEEKQRADSPDKSNKSGSRFGWLWGNDSPDAKGRNRKLAMSTRKRSKTISKNDGDLDIEDIPIPNKANKYHSSKSEAGIDNPFLEEVKISNKMNKSQNISEFNIDNVEEDGDKDRKERSPNKKGLFRRFFGFFRGNKKEENDPQNMFKLEKVRPKGGDSGEMSPTFLKSFKTEVGMSLCKNQLFTCEKEEVDEIFEHNQVSFEEF